MTETYNKDGDLEWFNRSHKVGDIVYRYSTTSQLGRVIEVAYEEIPHLTASYAPAGKRVVSQQILVRWLKKATRKRFGEESWEQSHIMNSLVVLAESHRRKAEKFEQEISEAQKL